MNCKIIAQNTNMIERVTILFFLETKNNYLRRAMEIKWGSNKNIRMKQLKQYSKGEDA
jgi:hypothetical protein